MTEKSGPSRAQAWGTGTRAGHVEATPFPWALLDGEPWMGDSLCPQTDPDAFFPEKGGSTKDAKQICASCPVAEQCLIYAIDRDERYGIWGGQSERERRAIKAGRRPWPTFAKPERKPVVVAPDPADAPLIRRSAWTVGQNARMVQLVNEKATDAQIAKAMRVSIDVIRKWRGRAGLPANRPIKARKARLHRRKAPHVWTDADTALLIELHGQRLSDNKIAKVIGASNATVSGRRAALGLPRLFDSRWGASA